MSLCATGWRQEVSDRESGVTLCHGVALKKGSIEDRESSVALGHRVELKKNE